MKLVRKLVFSFHRGIMLLGDSMWERLDLLIGKEKRLELEKKTVLVLGLGGVGGYSVESLVRAGIGSLILVDYDTIDVSNCNRQLIATQETIGMKKVDAWYSRIQAINPTCKISLIEEKITKENISLLFQQKVDYIIDACDTITVKKELIKECKKRNVPLISSMGTGNKLDPTKLEILDIRKTSYDPIAKIIRKMVKEEHIKGKVMVLCSTEKPIKTKEKVASISYVPSTAGLLLTSYVINTFLKETL